MERTLVLIKPDGIQRSLVGEIIKRFENKGLKLIGMKMMTLNDAVLDDHYAHLKGKPFFPGLVGFMKSSPVVVQIWEGVEAVAAVRKVTGITKAREAEMGSIRGDLAMSQQMNVIHCSDSVESSEKEIERFFEKSEIFAYDKTEWVHVYAADEK